MKPTDRSLRKLLEYYFKDFLINQRGLSANTISSYKETFKLFVPWLIEYTGASNLTIDDIDLFKIMEFLKFLEGERGNSITTRNARLAAIKSFFRMCYLLHSDTKKTFDGVMFIPFKRSHKPLIHYFEHEDALKITNRINIRTLLGFRDYAIINLLYDAGCRASEIGDLKIDCFDSKDRTLEIIGKGNKWRKIDLWPRTCQILDKYLKKARITPLPLYRNHLFINQRGGAVTRSGVFKICQRHAQKPDDLKKPLPSAKIQAVHSWRHSAAINMIRQGRSLLEVKTRLGHASYETTAKYLGMDLTIKRNRMDEFVKYISQFIEDEELSVVAEWNQKQDVIDYIKSL